MDDTKPDSADTKDEAELKRIRDRYNYLEKCWEETRKERAVDLRYLCGDPWDPKDRKAREDAGRPCISHDELRQYVNQAINNVRQNKRGIKVDPDGKGSDKKTAEFRQDLIRTIEYKCGASNIYITAFEQAIRGSYGFFRITRCYVGDGFEQEIVIKPILNPNSVLFDWDCKEADWSDARDCFVLDWMTREEFKQKYSKAQVKDFTTEHMKIAAKWIQEKKVLVAEYWKIESEYVKRYQLPTGEVVDEEPEGIAAPSRDYEKKTLVQIITNGVEIIKRIPQPGEIIPIIPVIGEEVWVDEGNGDERKLSSLVRYARDPQMSLAYSVSQEMEEMGLTPKSPYIGYKGQFESDAEAWETATKSPHAFLQADPIVDGANGAVLPLPRRESFVPNFQQYEIAKDSFRRAIQAAIGNSPLPTAMQRDSEKSGIALERIQQAQSVGSFHFVDNYDRSLRLAGRVIDSWIPTVYDSERDMMLQKQNDEFYKARINTAEPYIDEENQEQFYKVDQGSHHVTISTGPSYQSQMDQVSQFLDLLVANLATLPIAPEQQAKLLAQAIKMKQMGPHGDEMAEIISPSDKDKPRIPPEMIQQLQEMQQQLQALNEYGKQKEAEIQELKQKIDGQVVNNEYKLKIEQLKIEKDLAIAEITTKAQSLSERLKLVEDMMKQLEIHGHEHEMADHNAEISLKQLAASTENEANETEQGE
jgi:hypothetical protein